MFVVAEAYLRYISPERLKLNKEGILGSGGRRTGRRRGTGSRVGRRKVYADNPDFCRRRNGGGYFMIPEIFEDTDAFRICRETGW